MCVTGEYQSGTYAGRNDEPDIYGVREWVWELFLHVTVAHVLAGLGLVSLTVSCQSALSLEPCSECTRPILRDSSVGGPPPAWRRGWTPSDGDHASTTLGEPNWEWDCLLLRKSPRDVNARRGERSEFCVLFCDSVRLSVLYCGAQHSFRTVVYEYSGGLCNRLRVLCGAEAACL